MVRVVDGLWYIRSLDSLMVKSNETMLVVVDHIERPCLPFGTLLRVSANWTFISLGEALQVRRKSPLKVGRLQISVSQVSRYQPVLIAFV